MNSNHSTGDANCVIYARRSISSSYNRYERLNYKPRIIINNNKNHASTPGPGFYNVPDSSINKNKTHHIQSRTPNTYPTDAVDVTFHDVKLQHNLRLCSSIGSRKKLKYFDNPKTPGPSMPQPETLPKNPIIIGLKLKAIEDTTLPGPASYCIKENIKPNLVVSMKNDKTKRESFFTSKSEPGPGPGTYNPYPEIQRPKRWASKLRNVKSIPVAQLKRTLKKKKEELEYQESLKQQENIYHVSFNESTDDNSEQVNEYFEHDFQEQYDDDFYDNYNDITTIKE
ncbi:hypothetical protein TRFO_27553 [Tritrichomonas foetus]|uniref:Uncharacterized protein n=1 Tax=Tritrichomonas foetus TaxID=1144522 RepID=A0A1J4K5C3_9EUKA|nr:hypothetical protein TRFO_27553 [Tritrichomonas foetus]|eukprot:OHT04878.1 hypothetical protein TRFO_27553 [Tritrichomonas foetus]